MSDGRDARASAFHARAAQLAQLFLERTSQEAAWMRAQLDRAGVEPQAREQMRGLAHKITGSAATFGFEPISARARELEDALDVAQAQFDESALERLRDCLSTLENEIRKARDAAY